jgi:spore coat polysaccharide biosynthesis protein SpsF
MGRIIASIEARMSSSRLPGKVLLDINGVPSLTRQIRRLRRSIKIDDIVVATSTNPADDAIEAWAANENIACYRGSEDDVLLRVVEAQKFMNSEIVVEICGDTPLIDPLIIDQAVSLFEEGDCDIVSNTYRLSYPQGIDAQVFRLADLEEIERTIHDPAVREHVSLYFYENPEKYRLKDLVAPPGLTYPEQRLQLDYEEDLALIREVYRRLEPKYNDDFGVAEIIECLEKNPELGELNKHCKEAQIR